MRFIDSAGLEESENVDRTQLVGHSSSLVLQEKLFCRYRKNGVTALSESSEFELQRMKRCQKRKNDKKKLLIYQAQPGNFSIVEVHGLKSRPP